PRHPRRPTLRRPTHRTCPTLPHQRRLRVLHRQRPRRRHRRARGPWLLPDRAPCCSCRAPRERAALLRRRASAPTSATSLQREPRSERRDAGSETRARSLPLWTTDEIERDATGNEHAARDEQRRRDARRAERVRAQALARRVAAARVTMAVRFGVLVLALG